MPGGRPSKLTPELRHSMEFLARKGFTIEEISECLGIHDSTVRRWQQRFDEFFTALKSWKDAADRQVERSLFERATGYKCIDTKFATHEGKITDAREYTKHYPPDTTAAIFWLKNRKPDQYREVNHMKFQDVSNMTDSDLDREIASLKNETKE